MKKDAATRPRPTTLGITTQVIHLCGAAPRRAGTLMDGPYQARRSRLGPTVASRPRVKPGFAAADYLRLESPQGTCNKHGGGDAYAQSVTSGLQLPDPDDSSAPVEFPLSGQGKQIVALTRTASFRAWSGGPEELKRLAAAIEAALQREFTMLRDQNSRDAPQNAAKLNRELAQGMRLSVAAFARGGVERRSGDLAAILAELDPRDFDGMRIGNFQSASRAPHGYPVIDLTLGHIPGTSPKQVLGPRLRVSGGNRNWVSGTLDVVSDELSHRNPPWSILNTGWALLLVSVALAGGPFGIFYALIRPTVPEVGAFINLALILLLLFVALFASLLPKLFPPFEVVPTGDRDRGRRVLASVVAAASFALAVAGVALPFVLP